MDAADARSRGQDRESLPRRLDHRRRLRRARTGSGQRRVWIIFRKGKGDVFAPLIRDQAGRSAFGEPLIDVARTYLGSRKGPMRGRDGNIHRGRPREGQLAMISHLGAMISVLVGKLMAKRMKGEKDFIGLTTIGEGGMQTGASHEGLNIAAVEKVPLVVVATNNHFAYSTPNEREFACAHLVDRAKGYGYEGHTVDGTDLNACLDVIGDAVQRARAGRPPQLVVARGFASGRSWRTRRRQLCRRRDEMSAVRAGLPRNAAREGHHRAEIGRCEDVAGMARRGGGRSRRGHQRQRSAKSAPDGAAKKIGAQSRHDELVDQIS